VPGGGPVVTMKNVPEPDIEQRGGKVLTKFENRRLIQLPLAAAAELRRHEAVAFLQRVWTGESLEGWDERYVPPPPPAKGHMHEQRYNLKDPKVHKNTQTSDYNNSYESDFAEDVERDVKSEIGNYKGDNSRFSDIVAQGARETEHWMFDDFFGTQIEVTHFTPP
jgi:hypothetical protein